MNKEEILQKARQEQDERELVIMNKAYKLAGEVTSLVMAIMALYFVVDGFLLNDGKMYSHIVVGTSLVMIGTLFMAIIELYRGIKLGVKRTIIEGGIFGFVTVSLATIVVNNLFL